MIGALPIARHDSPAGHAKALTIELIMALVGRSHPKPREFRTRLEHLDGYELQQFLNSQTN